jgi:hypothetical protein
MRICGATNNNFNLTKNNNKMSYTFSDLGTNGVIALSHQVLARMQKTSDKLIERLKKIESRTIGSTEEFKYALVIADYYKALHQILNNLYEQDYFNAFNSKAHMKYVIDITNFSPYYLPVNIELAINDLSTDYWCDDNYMVKNCFESQIPADLHQYLDHLL